MSSSTPHLRGGVAGPLLTVVASGATLVLLAACGGGGGTRDEGVASIADPSATAGTTTADADAGQVRIRLDDNQDDVNRLWDAWTDCLNEHGVPKDQKAPANSPALKACELKYPLQPVEMDPAKNPRYSDGVRAMVRCMNAHGIKSVVSEGNWAMASGDSMNLPNYDKYRVECQVKSFKNDG
ncbi:hypothetical protein OG223_50980 [Streptomyces sp. NBC_01478]|uniref:hypothetical protein n=1 Tax=Streptomyces sp. NBC_01478 TaxID=2903882 RepID=UPI002E32E0DC|nr:hypothetical protein [Streptomyces sp. NBC_01478]